MSNKKTKFNGKKLLIYDDEEIHYIEARVTEIDMQQHWIDYEDPHGHKTSYPTGRTYTFDTVEGFDTDTIKLDETLMKRIAKYNKEIEIQKLDEKIKEKKNKIKELDDILQDKDKRVEKIKEFIANIYDIDITDDDDYEDYD